MITQSTIETPTRDTAESLERRVRQHIESLAYLPSSAAVAMKFVELGQDLDTEPREYANVIGSDPALSAKILGLVNSSWFAVRQNVTSVPQAVNLLGLGTVRTLAISYCMAGIHNSLKLSADESKMFWEASLCKAVAAKCLATELGDRKLRDQAFAAGLFQDLALPVMFAADKERLLEVIGDATIDWRTQLERERSLFGMDHAAFGRVVAEKMQLPELFVDAVAFHHDSARLDELMSQDGMAQSVYAASLLPHVLKQWNTQDVEELSAVLARHGHGDAVDASAFLASVQQEFNRLYQFFENGEMPEAQLVDLMASASAEAADKTTKLLGHVNEMMQEAAVAGVQMNEVVNTLQDKATKDPLTGVLNREGFSAESGPLLEKAARYKIGVAAVYFDLDEFKIVNDTMGHEIGDAALKRVADCMTEAARRHDLIGRLGGDEFVLVMYDCDESAARSLAQCVVDAVGAQPLSKEDRSITLSISAGVLWTRAIGDEVSIETLVSAADELMYQAKRAGGSRISSRALTS